MRYVMPFIFCLLFALSGCFGCGQVKPPNPGEAPNTGGASAATTDAEKHNLEGQKSTGNAKLEVELGKKQVGEMQKQNPAPTPAFTTAKTNADSHLDNATAELVKTQDALKAESEAHTKTKQELQSLKGSIDEREKLLAEVMKERDDWKEKFENKGWDRWHRRLGWAITVMSLLTFGVAAYLRLVEQSIIRMACALIIGGLVVATLVWIDINLEKIMEVLGWTLAVAAVLILGTAGIGCWLHFRKHRGIAEIASDAKAAALEAEQNVTSFVKGIQNTQFAGAVAGAFNAADVRVVAAAKNTLSAAEFAIFKDRYNVPAHVG